MLPGSAISPLDKVVNGIIFADGIEQQAAV
jgi:hypothetical protein